MGAAPAPPASAMEMRAYQLVSLALAAGFMFGLPELARRHWDALRLAVNNDDQLTHVGTWATNVVLTLVANLALAVIYAARLPFFERWKLSAKPWPWHSKDAATRAEFWRFLPRCVGLVVFNNFCVALPMALLIRDKLPTAPLAASELPGLPKMLAQIAAMMVIEDSFFYWSHRLLHVRAFYPLVHKWHHTFHQPWAMASEYAHPVEFVLGNILPVIAGPHILAHISVATGIWHFLPHCFVIMMWMLIRVATSIDNHCGYAFPWSPVRLLPGWLGLSTDAHDFHHSHNTGLFASQFRLWDRLLGTDAHYVAWKDGQAGGSDAAPPTSKGKAGKAL